MSPLTVLVGLALTQAPPALPDEAPSPSTVPSLPAESDASEPDPAEAPSTADPEPDMPVTVEMQDGRRVVDLADESTWEGLSPTQRDKLRAERARRDAGTAPLVPAPSEASEQPPAATRRWDAGSTNLQRQTELQAYYEMKERRLVTSTAVFGGVWGVLTLGALVAAGTGNGSPGLYAVIGVGTGVSGLGTIVSGTMLGAHRNTRPLYFAASPGGLTLRF